MGYIEIFREMISGFRTDVENTLMGKNQIIFTIPSVQKKTGSLTAIISTGRGFYTACCTMYAELRSLKEKLSSESFSRRR